jgi:hypothetical protein
MKSRNEVKLDGSSNQQNQEKYADECRQTLQLPKFLSNNKTQIKIF